MEKLTKKTELFHILSMFDNVFDPALSEDVLDLKRYSEKLAKNAVTYVIEEKDQAAGFISFYASDETQENSFIVLLAVLPEFHGKRIAQKLMELCILESLCRNKKGIKLEVQKDNSAAVRFYEKNNFRVTEETTRGSVYMLRKLL